MNKLKGKVAVVTGGNSGIGYETAKKFKKEGASVVIIGRSEENINKAANELGVAGLVADIKNISDMKKVAEKVKEEFQKIDILFVNAGVYFGAPIGQHTEDLVNKVIDINFKGAVYTVENFLPIISDGGSIVGSSTMLADVGMAGGSIYSASKSALDAYLRAAVTELTPRKIRVNMIKAGPINTPIHSKTGMPNEMLEGFTKLLQEKIPLKSFGSPEDVANAVLFIVSDEARFINGSELTVDGGLNINPILG